jgi:hypothetical protein
MTIKGLDSFLGEFSQTSLVTLDGLNFLKSNVINFKIPMYLYFKVKIDDSMDKNDSKVFTRVNYVCRKFRGSKK